MERHHHRVFAALSVFAAVASVTAVSSSGVARAQAEEALDEEAAARLFDAGVVHLRAQRFEEAAEDFRRSYRAARRVETMCNLALTYDRWGEHQDLALRAYRTCARDDETGRFRGYAEQRVEEIERELALAAAEDPDASPPPPEDPSQADVTPPPPPPEPDHSLLYAGLTVGGLALAAMGVGIGFALESNTIVNDLTDRLGPEPVLVRGTPDHDRYENALLFADVATAMYVLMGSMLAASGAMIAVDLVVSASANEPHLALVPAGTGASLRGRF